jgi:putative tricarboxylic transport membrane protein
MADLAVREKKMKTLTLAAIALGSALLAAPAYADPASVMAPGGAGGGYDGMARQPFEAMRRAGIFTEGATFTNKGGAGGTIGLAEFANTSKGNEDNSLMSMGAILVGGILTYQSPVALEQVTPLVRLINDTGAIAVPPDSEFETIQDVVAALGTDIGGTSIGGGSIGGVDHIVMGLLAQEAGVEPVNLNYVPFPGGADVVAALAGSTVKVGVSGLSEFKPLADAGRIKILAVTSAERVEGIDAPTLTEAGYDIVVGNWRGIVGAGGMSDEAKQAWLDRFAQMHQSDEWKEILVQQNWEDAYLAGDDFAAFLDEEEARQEDVLKSLGVIQ